MTHTTQNDETNEPTSLREKCLARHQRVYELIDDFRYMSAIKELESIVKMVDEA